MSEEVTAWGNHQVTLATKYTLVTKVIPLISLSTTMWVVCPFRRSATDLFHIICVHHKQHFTNVIITGVCKSWTVKVNVCTRSLDSNLWMLIGLLERAPLKQQLLKETIRLSLRIQHLSSSSSELNEISCPLYRTRNDVRRRNVSPKSPTHNTHVVTFLTPFSMLQNTTKKNF